jgi:hypothetical protein
MGIRLCIPSHYEPASTTPSTYDMAPTSSHSLPVTPPSLLTQAIHQQYHDIGWEHFLYGKLSNTWKEACYEECLKKQHWINKDRCATGAVKAILHYSLSLWKCRCLLLHGRTKEEAYMRQLQVLQEQITLAYQEYVADPFFL